MTQQLNPRSPSRSSLNSVPLSSSSGIYSQRGRSSVSFKTAPQRPSVITSPPWARDETPSPTEENPPVLRDSRTPENVQINMARTGTPLLDTSSSGDAASTTSDSTERPGGRWWMFAAKPRKNESPSSPQSPNRAEYSRRDSNDPHNDEGEIVPHTGRPLMKERTRPSWFFDHRTPSIVDVAERWRASKEKRKAEPDVIEADEEEDSDVDENQASSSSPRTPRRPTDQIGTRLNRMVSGTGSVGLHLQMPTPPERPFTLNHAQTPGWDSPWAPHNHRLPDLNQNGDAQNGLNLSRQSSTASSRNGRSGRRSKAGRRKANFRHFLLHNNYAPLLFRMLNLTATTSTLAIAISERRLELTHHVLGAIGSSVTLVIIFAPFTLVHVLIAIYLEYFGRPLGLWRTSAKLMHTLSETVFICAWSSALSLCFDNLFTSPLDCEPRSSTSWWNQLPAGSNPLGDNFEGSLSDDLCNHQVALIILVFFGLLTYCSSLCLSLFRIFEKVKYRTTAQS